MKTPDQTPDPAPAVAAPGAHRAVAPPGGAERRRNSHLRELIEEMLVSIRVATNRDLWTAEERQGAEAELTRIMEQVRVQAFRNVT